MRALHTTLAALVLAWGTYSAAAADDVIQFRKGETSGTVRGEVIQFNKTYLFRARKGQHITVTLAPAGGDKGMLTFTLNAYCGEEYGSPLADQVLRWQGMLPCSDRFSIDVSPSREAAEHKRVQPFVLTLAIR